MAVSLIKPCVRICTLQQPMPCVGPCHQRPHGLLQPGDEILALRSGPWEETGTDLSVAKCPGEEVAGKGSDSFSSPVPRSCRAACRFVYQGEFGWSCFCCGTGAQSGETSLVDLLFMTIFCLDINNKKLCFVRAEAAQQTPLASRRGFSCWLRWSLGPCCY